MSIYVVINDRSIDCGCKYLYVFALDIRVPCFPNDSSEFRLSACAEPGRIFSAAAAQQTVCDVPRCLLPAARQLVQVRNLPGYWSAGYTQMQTCLVLAGDLGVLFVVIVLISLLQHFSCSVLPASSEELWMSSHTDCADTDPAEPVLRTAGELAGLCTCCAGVQLVLSFPRLRVGMGRCT